MKKTRKTALIAAALTAASMGLTSCGPTTVYGPPQAYENGETAETSAETSQTTTTTTTTTAETSQTTETTTAETSQTTETTTSETVTSVSETGSSSVTEEFPEPVYGPPEMFEETESDGQESSPDSDEDEPDWNDKMIPKVTTVIEVLYGPPEGFGGKD